ncbi:MAG TPA: hypothetical protein VF068_00870 [Rubrobacter sp.]
MASGAALLVTLIVLHSAAGLYDVGINADAVDLEQVTRRRFMALLHATFSGGATLGAVGAGVLIQAAASTHFPSRTNGTPGDIGGNRYALYRHLPLLLVGAIATLGLLS